MVLPSRARMLELLRSALTIWLAWLAAAVCLIVKDVLTGILSGQPAPPAELIADWGVYALTWAAATPVIVQSARTFTLRRPRRLRNVLIFPATVIVAAVLLYTLKSAILNGDRWRAAQLNDRAATLLAMWDNITPIAFIAFITRHLDHRAANARRRRDAAELQSELARVQLRQLRADLDPHFLFNALNAVSALIRSRPEEGEAVLRELTALLRRSFETHARNEIPLQEETGFLLRYLYIYRMRFGPHLATSMHLAPGTERALVPPLVLQPLVENAIVHGIRSDTGAGAVEVRAFTRSETLCLEVRDTGPGFEPGEERAGGIGIANIRARLRLMFGDAQSLVHRRDGRWFAAVVTIPLRYAGEREGMPAA